MSALSDSELRERYQALHYYKRFEDLAARFSREDLEFLLTDTDELKLAYIRKNGEVPKGADLRAWIGACLSADDVGCAIEVGHTVSVLQQAVSLALEIDPSRSPRVWRNMLLHHPTSLEYLRACAAASVDGRWHQAGVESGAKIEMLKALRELDVPARFVTKDIIEGSADAPAVQQWYMAGISPWAADQFVPAGMNSEQTLAWLLAGFIPEEAIERVRARRSLKACVARCPKSPTAKLFGVSETAPSV